MSDTAPDQRQPDAAEPAASGRYIVIAEAPFMPAMGGGEREHLGFVQTMAHLGLLASVVVPTDDDPAGQGRSDDLGAIRALVAPAPVIETPRRRTPRAAIGLRPYVHRSRPMSRELAEKIMRESGEARGIIAFSYKVAHLGRQLGELTGLPVVVRMHNQEGRYFTSIARSSHGPAKAMAALEAARILADERLLERAAWVSGLADISRSDATERAARSRVRVIDVPTFALGPQDARAIPERRPDPDTPQVLFLGALDVRTNVDAITWFARNVWPLVTRRCPAARWQVVGRKPLPEVNELVASTPGAELHADVPAPSDYYATASVAVNPAVSGSGVNIKLVEYLAAGIPVVSTTLGMQGVGLTPGEDILVHDDAESFATAVAMLLTDPEAARALGERGRASASEIQDVAASVHRLLSLFPASDERR